MREAFTCERKLVVCAARTKSSATIRCEKKSHAAPCGQVEPEDEWSRRANLRTQKERHCWRGKGELLLAKSVHRATANSKGPPLVLNKKVLRKAEAMEV